jgi:hypothetical protein
MNSDRIDTLTAELDRLVKRLDSEIDKATHRVTVEHIDDGDGGDGYDDVSNPSMHASDDDDDDNDNPDDYPDEAGGEEDDGEDALDKLAKATIMRNDSSNRPGALATSSHPANRRHKFEALTEKIANDEGVPKSQAQALARQRYPDIYSHYVGSAGSYLKCAPVTFEDYVNVEMAKGCSREVASKRVMQQHGFPALQHRAMSKRDLRAELAENQFHKAAQDIWCDDPDISRTEALRKARLANPRLIKAMQR